MFSGIALGGVFLFLYLKSASRNFYRIRHYFWCWFGDSQKKIRFPIFEYGSDVMFMLLMLPFFLLWSYSCQNLQHYFWINDGYFFVCFFLGRRRKNRWIFGTKWYIHTYFVVAGNYKVFFRIASEACYRVEWGGVFEIIFKCIKWHTHS